MPGPYLKLRDTIVLPYGGGWEAKDALMMNVYDTKEGLIRLNIIIANDFMDDTKGRLDGEWNNAVAHIISLQSIESIDTPGYYSILKINKRLREKFPLQENPLLGFIEAKAEVRKLAMTTKLDGYIPFYRDVEELKELYPEFPEMILQPVHAR